MKLEEFKNNLAVYGGNLTKWPAARRKSAEGLLARSVEAQDLFSEATSLDMLIDPDGARPPDDLLDKTTRKTKDRT